MSSKTSKQNTDILGQKIPRAALDKMITSIFLFTLLACGLIRTASGNVRFVCPRPTSPKSDQAHINSWNHLSSCDPNDDSGVADVTDLEPGLFTVRFEETKFQSDSVFRIALIDNAEREQRTNDTNTTTVDFDEQQPSCLLLDHIPHNNQAVITKECAKTANDYPLGVCNESNYYITIRIPDVACDNCSLMLQQVITKKGHEVCDLTQEDDTSNGTVCIIYSSCAKVRVRPSSGGSRRDLSYCSDYLQNLPGDWSYRPQDIYKADFGAAITMDLLHKNLKISVPKIENIGLLERVEVRHNSTVIWNATIEKQTNGDGDTKVTWEALSEIEMDLLKNGRFVLNIVGKEKSLAADIEYLEQHFGEGKVSSLHDVYSESGWLISFRFLGPDAEDPVAALPAGTCAPEASYFTAFLNSVHVTAHGILGMTVVENRAYITAVVHVEREEILLIRIKGPDLVDIPTIEIPVSSHFTGVVQGAFDVTKHIKYINTVRFLKLVEVKTDKEEAVLVGDLEEGMYSILRDEKGEIHGLGAVRFTQGQWMRIEVVLNNLAAPIGSAVVQGLGQHLLDLSREAIHCTQEFCCLETMNHEVSSELLLHLIKSQASIDVQTKKSNVRGMIVGSALRHCLLMGGTCHKKFQQFSLHGMGVEKMVRGGQLSKSRGWTEAEAYILDRVNILHYCVQVDNLDWNGKIVTVALVRGGEKINEAQFKPLTALSNSWIACSDFPIVDNPPLISSLSHTSHKRMDIVIYEDGKKFFSQDLPSIYRAECSYRKIFVVGKDKEYWSPESSVLPDIYAVVSDGLKFIFDHNTTLYNVDSKDNFDNCNFDTSKQLLPLGKGGDKSFYYHDIDHLGTLYFADIHSCNTSQPLKLVVHVIIGENIVQDGIHDEWCRKSVYKAWRDNQLMQWSEPDVSGPILIGLVVGLSSAAVFLLWQGIRLKRLPDSLRGGGDSTFVRF